MSASRRLGLVALAVLVAIGASVLVAAPVRPAHAAGPDLPPPQLAKLQKRYNPVVKPLGFRISRGMLQSLETYEEDPEGTHLALYVEPIEPGFSDARYLKTFTTLTRKFVPRVFDKWKGLESFDICQEPVDDPREVPPPYTQIFVTRDALDRVGNWKTANLTALLAASPRVRSVAAGYYVYFAPELRDEPAFVAAAAKAGWTTGSTAFGH
ncbi:MAG: hypothetical protein FJW95_12770 [Actinobacteria bacterium]|nr:hypothetical protein [Actinomycetota bacterium]